MKSHVHTRATGSGSSNGRGAATSALPYMSERQTQAYLMARDTIRRIQRTSPIIDSISSDVVQRLQAPYRCQNIH